MASIDKLEICGIRAFSPENNAVIEFYSPLTMIIGANGCGKTTVIESLKFVCSGVLPPNTKSGQSFINDPQMTDAQEIKAHVKLRFQNRRGYDCVATRNLQITRKKNKLEFKALDSVLKTKDDHGEVSSISMKCSELDRQIPDYLGVSSAVMENVIFCHQEESDWPMQDGASVKKRFDDIFDSTRYSKALEAIHKAKKELVNDTKELKIAFAELSERLRSAETYRDELKSTTEEVSSTSNEVRVLVDRCNEYTNKIKDLKQIVSKQMGSRNELENLTLRISELKKRIEEKEQGLDRIYSDSDAELQTRIDTFDSSLVTMSSRLRELQQEIDRTNSQIQTGRDSFVATNKQLAAMEMQFQQLEQQLAQQKEQFLMIGKKHNIPTQVNTFNEFKPIFDSKVFQAKDSISRELEALRTRSKSDSKALQDKQSADQRLEMEVNHHSNEVKKMSQEISDKRIQLTSLSSAQKDLENAQREFQEATIIHDEFLATFQVRTADFKKQIKDYNQRLVDIDDVYSSDDQLLQDLSLNRQETAMISALDKRIEEDTNNIKTDLMSLFSHRHVLIERIRPELIFYISFASAPSKIDEVEKLRAFIDERTSLVKAENQTLSSDDRRLERERDKCKALLETEKERLDSLKLKKNSIEIKNNQWQLLFHEAKSIDNKGILDSVLDSRLVETSDHTNLQDFIDQAKTFIGELVEAASMLSCVDTIKRKLLKLKAKHNSCPVCQRGFPDATHSANFEVTVDDFVQKIVTSDVAKEVIDEALEKWKSISDRLSPFANNIEPMREIKDEMEGSNQKCMEFMAQLTDLDSRYESNAALLATSNDDLSLYEDTLSELSEIVGKWRTVDVRRQELQEKRRRQTQSLSNFDSNDRSYEEIDQAQRQRREEKDDIIKKKERVRIDEENLNKRFNVQKTSLVEKEKLVSEYRFKGAKHSDLENSMRMQQTELDSINSKVKQILRDREEAKRALTELSANSKKSQTELQQLEDKERSNNLSFSSDGDNMLKLQENIEKIKSKVNREEIDKLKQSIATLQKDISTKEELVRSCQPRYNSVLADLSNQERAKKTLVGNVDLRKANGELVQLESAKALKVSQSGADERQFQEAQRNLQKMEQDAQLAATKRDKLQGKLESLQQQFQTLTSKLDSSLFQGIDEKHQRKLIEVETTVLATQDLDNYYNALDSALQSFHTQKIKAINTIIRELWQLIYKGEDIDMIEVESGQEAGAAVTAKGSRSYNYRVVMRKGNIPLDMRGRCSAGQRVLASIVIRLALAETFCLNCGILALDEPTTNLDERNKLGLASALARIIQSRSKQQNFQLICITHDEEFLKCMNLELSATAIGFSKPEYYFRISRQEVGNSGRFFSKIDRIPWDDMG